MLLSIKDRVILPSLMKEQSDFMTITIQRDIRKKTALTQVEILGAGLTVENGPDGRSFTRWDTEKSSAMDIPVEFTKPETELLKKLVEEISRDRVTEENYDLIKKIKEL